MSVSRNAVLILCTGALLLTSVGSTSFSMFLPPMEAEFGWTRVISIIPYTVAMLAWGISSPVFGKLADDFGARPVILGGIVLMAAGFVGMGLAQNLWQMSLSFGLTVGVAMGAGGLSIISLLISKHFDAHNRGLAVSIVQTASPLNPLLFAPLLYLMMTAFNWRVAALIASALLVGVALPLAWVGARDPATVRPERETRLGWRACFPHLRRPAIIWLMLARFSCGLAYFQIAHLVTLSMSKGFSTVVGATALSIFGAAAIGCALLFGWLSDRYGRGRMLSLSYFVRGAGTLAMVFTLPNEWVYYALVVVAIGPTFGTIAVNNVMFYEAVGPRLAGMMLGLSFIVHQIGSALGPLLGSVAYDVTGNYNGFLLLVGVILLASGAMTYNLRHTAAPLAEPVAAVEMPGD